MPLLSALAAPFQLIGGAITDAIGQKRHRRQVASDRDFQKYMYTMQRSDAMEDWNRNNIYNSPEQQMERLKQAGLNPHLVYGKGADNTAAMVRSSQPSGGNAPPPKMDNFMSPVANDFVQNLQTEASTDNLHEQNRLLVKEGILKDATTAKTVAETANSKFSLGQAQALNDMVIKKAEQDLLAGAQSIEIAGQRNKREEAANTANVRYTLQSLLAQQLSMAKTSQEVAHIKAQIERTKSDTIIQSIEKKLAEKNINPKDPWYARKIQEFFEWFKF